MAIIPGEPLNNPAHVTHTRADTMVYRSRYLVDLFGLIVPLGGETILQVSGNSFLCAYSTNEGVGLAAGFTDTLGDLDLDCNRVFYGCFN